MLSIAIMCCFLKSKGHNCNDHLAAIVIMMLGMKEFFKFSKDVFLASQDALEVMLVSQSVSNSKNRVD